MKFVCPRCERLVDVGRFRVDGEALVLACPRCGEESSSAAAAEASAGVGDVPPTLARGALPAAAVGPAAAAGPAPALRPLVGLASAPHASNVVMLRTAHVEAVEQAAKALEGDPFAAPEGYCPKCISRRPEGATSCAQCGLIFKQLAPATLEPPGWLADGWRALLGAWDDDSAHERLRQRAAREAELVPLARLYRVRLAAMPTDPIAEHGRDEVLRLAAAPVAFMAGRQSTPSGGSARRWIIGGAIAFLLLTMSGLAVTLFRSVR